MALPRSGPTWMAAPGLPASSGPRGPRCKLQDPHPALHPHLRPTLTWGISLGHAPLALSHLAPGPATKGSRQSPQACPQALQAAHAAPLQPAGPLSHSLFRLHLKCKKRRKKSPPCGDSGQDRGGCEGEFCPRSRELRVQPSAAVALSRGAASVLGYFFIFGCAGPRCRTRAVPRRGKWGCSLAVGLLLQLGLSRHGHRLSGFKAGVSAPGTKPVSPRWQADSSLSSVQSLSCVRFCDPMDCSTPSLPVLHQLPESTETHVH